MPLAGLSHSLWPMNIALVDMNKCDGKAASSGGAG
jgi:hypothetical protein